MSICIRFFSNFRGQNWGEICIHRRSKQGWHLYTIGQGKGDICLLYFTDIKDFLESKLRLLLHICFKSHVQFVYCCLKTMVNFVYSDNARSKQCRILYTSVKAVMKFVSNDIFASFKCFPLRIYKGFTNMYSVLSS